MPENQHSHHHHHHHHHENDGIIKKISKKISKKTALKIALGVVALIIAVVLIISISKNSSNIGNRGGNIFNYTVKDGEFEYTANNLKSIYIKYGRLKELENKDLADFSSVSQRDKFTTEYNGIYTAFIEYKNKENEIVYFEIKDIPVPITLTKGDNTINISVNGGYKINFMYYTYGLTLGNPYANYISVNPSSTSVDTLGRGFHTFRINATSNNLNDAGTRTFYVAIDMSSLSEPVVVASENQIGLFSSGFDVISCCYAKGAYGSWDEMVVNAKDLVYTGFNGYISKDDFDFGMYTFCFRTPNKDYIIKEAIN